MNLKIREMTWLSQDFCLGCHAGIATIYNWNPLILALRRAQMTANR